MNALILSVSAGGGHKNAAEAVKEEILFRDPSSSVTIIDTIKYISPALDKLIIGTYLSSLKIYPSAYSHIYSLSDISSEDDMFRIVTDKIHELIAQKLIPLIKESKPDILVSTHPFTTYMLHMIRRKFRMDLPNMAILTDYGSHSMWAHTDIDRYIVADESMAPELTVHGVAWDDILPLGIPVKNSLKTIYDRVETLKEIGLDPNNRTIVLMGGSLAMGNLIPILEEIDNVPMDFNVVVIAANNKKLYDEAVEISLTSNKSITVLGYCNFMNSVMQASDLLITKPGGLTITEAIINGLPMLIFPAIPGQEEQNARFLLRNNLAYNLESGDRLKKQLISILSDDRVLKDWSERLKEKSKPDSTIKIVNTIETQIEQYRQKKEQGIPTLELSTINEDNLNYRVSQFFRKFSDMVESNLSLDRILQRVKSTMEVSIEDYSEPDEKDLALNNMVSDSFSKIKMNLINKRTWIRNPFEGPLVNKYRKKDKN